MKKIDKQRKKEEVEKLHVWMMIRIIGSNWMMKVCNLMLMIVKGAEGSNEA